jgi:acetolactate synthase I/III small subunit
LGPSAAQHRSGSSSGFTLVVFLRPVWRPLPLQTSLGPKKSYRFNPAAHQHQPIAPAKPTAPRTPILHQTFFTSMTTISPAQPPIKQEYTFTVYTENHIGLLNRIAIIFSRRKINVDSLNVSPSEIEGIHRFTIVIDETEDVVNKLARQIEKQVEVLKVYYNTPDEVIWQELALYKVPTAVIAESVKVERLLRQHGAKAVVIRKDYTVFEVSGHREETDNFIRVLEPYGLIEFVRSARVAIINASSGFHEKLKEFESEQPGTEAIENEYLNRNAEVFYM